MFKSDIPIREAQIVQEALDRIRVRYVPVAGFSRASAHTITKRLRDRMGHVTVLFEAVDQVPRGANGKFRAVVCNVSPLERQAARRGGAARPSSPLDGRDAGRLPGSGSWQEV